MPTYDCVTSVPATKSSNARYDSDAANAPGNAELCDGQDNDCDAATEAPGGEIDGDGDGAWSCEDCDDDPPTHGRPS